MKTAFLATSVLVLTALVIAVSPAHAQLVTITPSQGQAGPTGSTGSAGTNGNTVLSGTGAPSAGLGNNGDYYIDTAAKTVYGPKASGAWGSATNIVGPQGAIGSTGATGSAGVNAFGTPNGRTLSAATAYQATDTTKPALVSISLTSSAAISLSGGTTNTAGVYVGTTSGVATTGGVQICGYSNSNTGALTIGLNLATVATTPCTFALPTAGYFAFRVSSGTVTAALATDSSVG